MSEWIISVPVADLRREAEHLLPRDFSHHSFRDSQLLFGEKVQIQERKDRWVRIAALEQPRFRTDQEWHPYPGWVEASEIGLVQQGFQPDASVSTSWLEIPSHAFPLSYGTLVKMEKNHFILPTGEKYPLWENMIRQFPSALSRSLLLSDLKLFLGKPYLWGGKASFDPHRISGVDCSGLLTLLFRAQGKIIPRDAHDQYLAARPVTHERLKPGDCVFLKRKEAPQRITHVVIYTGSLSYVEAPETGKSVRQLSFTSSLGEIVNLEDRPYEYIASYGTFFPD